MNPPHFVGKVSAEEIASFQRYLAQVEQGLVHTNEWKSKMLEIHQQYLEDRSREADLMAQWYESQGYLVSRAGNELFVTSPDPHPRQWTWPSSTPNQWWRRLRG